MLPAYILELLQQKAGCDILSAAGAGFLCNDIQSQTREYISVNTIKRLIGVLPYDGAPRPATLDVIARYLGHSSWQALGDYISQGSSDFNADHPFVRISELPVETGLTIEWDSDRTIQVRHAGQGRCLVVSSTNSKLQADDILHLSEISEGYPLFATNVIRDGQNLGTFTAGTIGGLTRVIISEP